MFTFIDLKKLLIDKRITFTKLAKLDGRSRQYLFKECKAENKKVLLELYEILLKI